MNNWTSHLRCVGPCPLSFFVNSDLSGIASWSRDNGLSLDVRKTQAMFVRRSTVMDDEPRLFLDGSELSFPQSLTNLGFVMTSGLGAIL
jgi:hypothetical protein